MVSHLYINIIHDIKIMAMNPSYTAGLFKAGFRQPRVNAKFENRYETLKSKFSLIF